MSASADGARPRARRSCASSSNITRAATTCSTTRRSATTQYDALLDELRAIEREHPELLSADSPTQRVGGEPVGKLEKVKHLEPMLSLGNVRSEEELRAWVEHVVAARVILEQLAQLLRSSGRRRLTHGVSRAAGASRSFRSKPFSASNPARSVRSKWIGVTAIRPASTAARSVPGSSSKPGSEP